MQTPREKSIQASILKWLRTLANCKVLNVHGNEYMEAGTPDIIGCLNGRTFCIEVKRPGQHPTVLQRKRLAEWAAAGAVVGVAHNLDEAKQIIANILP